MSIDNNHLAFIAAAGITAPAVDSFDILRRQHIAGILSDVRNFILMYDGQGRLDTRLEENKSKDAPKKNDVPVLDRLVVSLKDSPGPHILLFALAPFRESERLYLGYITTSLGAAMRSPVGLLREGQTELSDREIAEIFALIGDKLKRYLAVQNAPTREAEKAKLG
jgi:hypothetical protein